MRLRSMLAGLAVVLIVGSAVAPGAIAAVTDDLNTADHDEVSTAPNPYKHIGTWTVAQHPMAEGSDHTAMSGYEDDNGNWVAGEDTAFEVNTSWQEDDGENANPYSFRPGHIVDSSFGAFENQTEDSWQNASNWVVASGSGNVTLSDTTVNADADAVRFDATGVTSPDAGDVVYEAKFTNVGADSDEEKRVLQFGADVDTLQSDARVQVRIVDESSDYKQFTMNASEDFANNNTILGNATSDFVKQVKLSDVATVGGGDFDNIETVSIKVLSTGTSADTDFAISWLDLRKKSKTELGERRHDGTDSDSDWDDFETLYNATNTISVYSMETLDSEFDDATINDVDMPARYTAGGLDEAGEDGEYVVYWDEAQNPGFDSVLNVTYAIELPSAVDLSYSNVELRMTQKWSESRYLTLETAEDVSDSTNLSEASYTSQASTLASRSDELVLDSTGINAGDKDLVHFEVELTEDERMNQVEAAADGGDGGDGGAPQQDTGGGFFSTIQGWIVAGLGGLGVFAFLRRMSR